MPRLIDKLAWIHIHNRRVLSARSQGKDTFYLPGGKREHGETDQACLLREIREELSVLLQPDTLSYVGQFEAPAHGHSQDTIVRMTCYAGAYRGILVPGAEIAEIAWLQYRDKPRTSAVTQIIFDWLKERDLIN